LFFVLAYSVGDGFDGGAQGGDLVGESGQGAAGDGAVAVLGNVNVGSSDRRNAVAVTAEDRSDSQRIMAAVRSASSAPVWRAQARVAAARASALP
jgi:hypothetical protein